MPCHSRGFLRSVYPPDEVDGAYRSILCRMVQAPHSRDVGMGYSVSWALASPPVMILVKNLYYIVWERLNNNYGIKNF